MKTTRLIIPNKRLKFNLIAVLASCCLLCGCNKKPDLSPENEDFYGTYLVRDLTVVQSAGSLDSVYFQIFKNTTYDMTFYENVNSADVIDFCDHGGTILDFGTGKVSFDPTLISRNPSCDTLNIPRGTFTADFVNHGDTIWISKRITNNSSVPTYDSLFMLKLLK